MKIRVSLKDPDTMHDAVVDAVFKHTRETVAGVSAAEVRELANERQCEVQSEITRRWMPYGEYLLVEFDTDDWTARVLPASEHK